MSFRGRRGPWAGWPLLDDTPEFLDPGTEKQRERQTIGLPAPAGPILGQKARLTGAGNNPTVYRARENRDCVDTS